LTAIIEAFQLRAESAEKQCMIEAGDESQEVSQGMAVFIPKGVEHELSVLEPLKILVFYSPPLNRSTVSR